MDVKYEAAKWEIAEQVIGDLIGTGRKGRGIFTELEKLDKSMKNIEEQINKYDEDRSISFQYTSHRNSFGEVHEAYYTLYDYVRRIGGIVDDIIDDPFYKDIDKYVTEMRNATIANYTTDNRIGATEIRSMHYQGKTEYEVIKDQVSVEDLFSGDSFYADQIQSEWMQVKDQIPDGEFTLEDYQQVALNTHAFEYDSLLDGQQKKEFWGHIIALTVIVTATVIFLSAGAVLAGAYGVMEVTSAVEGKDWISNRDLNAGERWFRGILSIADIVPAVASVSKFKTLGNTGWLKQLGAQTLHATNQMKHSMQDVVSTARLEGISRLRNAKTYALERARQAILKTEKSAVTAMKKADELGTNAKNNLNIFASREELSLAGIGNMGKVADNSHKLENATKGMYSKVKGSGGSKFKDIDNLKLKNESEYFNHINEIGKRTDLTSEQKLAEIHKAYAALDTKGDVTVVANMKYLKSEPFIYGRLNIDWPDKMGFVEESIQSINRNNPLPAEWDRVGGKGGTNFTTLPNNREPYTYAERAIPYLENPSARHVGTFNNNAYFDAIDAIKTGNLDVLNDIVIKNQKKPMSTVEFTRITKMYTSFQKNSKVLIGENVDTTYGLKGNAMPWRDSSGTVLMEGGAEQIVTPISANFLERIGVISKY